MDCGYKDGWCIMDTVNRFIVMITGSHVLEGTKCLMMSPVCWQWKPHIRNFNLWIYLLVIYLV